MNGQPYDRDHLEALARAREAIENAIVVLKTHRESLTEGQVKDIKRIIYSGDEF